MTPRELDEDDVRIRAGRGSRRRTRQRPAYEGAQEAMVVAVDRGRYTCRVSGTGPPVVAVRGGEVRRTPVVVGDQVTLIGDSSGTPDTLARIVSISPRRSILRRTPDDTDPIERPVVANADQLVIVTALADPEPRPRMIDRCLVAAYDGGLRPVLCLTKGDLASPAELTRFYTPLGFPILTTRPGADLGEVRELLAGQVSVFFGHSGVGKSTLVNRLVPDADRAVAEVNEVTGRGRHTSASAVALALPGGGWVIDTPGVRSFGLGAVSLPRLLQSFPDLAPAAEHCPSGCTHLADAPGCTLDEWAASGHAEPARLASLRRLLAERFDPPAAFRDPDR